MSFTKEDFEEYDGQYFVGHVVDVDGSPWVDEETLELIVLELNACVTDNVTFAVPNRPEVVYTQVMPDDKLNWLHLN